MIKIKIFSLIINYSKPKDNMSTLKYRYPAFWKLFLNYCIKGNENQN